MKILFVTKEIPYPINSGARMRTWHYIEGLRQAGDVHMICFGKEGDNTEGINALRQINVDVIFEESAPQWSSYPLFIARLFALIMPLPFSVLTRTSKSLKDHIRKIAQESCCDVLICDGIHLAFNIPYDLTCRKILDEHNVESTIIGRFFNLLKNPFVKIYAFLEWLKFRRFEKKIWTRFDEIHVCSKIDKMQVERRSKHPNVHVIPNGVALDTFIAENQRPYSKRLVYSGLMGWKPNDDAVLFFAREIYPLIKKDNPSVELCIVGKDPSQAVKNLAQDPSITITGFVDSVKPYVYQSDVFIVPLRIGSGTRLKILEAMSMGKPVVSTSIGCEGLEVTDGKNIFIADTPEAFADCVVRLLSDEMLNQSLAQAGRELVEKCYNWKQIESDLAQQIRGDSC